MSSGGAGSPGLAAVERLADAFNANDTAAVAAALDPHVTWHHNIGEGSPLEGTYHGSGAVAKLWDDVFATWEFLGFEDLVIEEESDRFVQRAVARLRARDSGLELALPSRIEAWVEDGRVVEVRFNSATGGR